MSLKLIALGKRRGNRFYLIRGRFRGKLYEYSTETTDKAVAEERLNTFTAERIQSSAADEPQEPDAVETFRQAAAAYCEFSPHLPAADIKRINKAVKVLGDRPWRDIKQAEITATANRLCPGQMASSKNRSVVTFISAILHYVAGEERQVKVKRFKEAKPETKALRQPAVERLIEAAWHRCNSFVVVMLVFLFSQGMRISDALAITWERLDLTEGLVRVKIGKADEWRWKALHPNAAAALAGLPVDPPSRTGRVFPWANRWAFYKALQPALEASGVKFTPHMARHTLGFMLGKVSMKTRMDIMDHKDPRSSMRYDMSQVEEQRAALNSVGDFVGSDSIPTKKAG